MGDKDKFRVGVIGATGYIGTPYRREIRETPGTRIVALCARRRELLEAAGREDNALLVTSEWRRVVDHPDINFVVVATPDALHHDAVMACAEAGKHVLCEKPVGANVSEAHRMWQAYKDANEPLAHFVPFWTRYVDVFRRAREWVREGRIGEIKAVIYRWQNPRPASMPYTWRDDPKLSAAGSIADVGSHAYDTMRWILEDEAARVLAHAQTLTPPKDDLGAVNLGEALDWRGEDFAAASSGRKKGATADYATVSWQFQRGAVGVLILSHATFLRKGLAPELELHGTEASLGVDRITGTLSVVRPEAEPEIVEQLATANSVNRFATHVFPALETFLAEGKKVLDYPDLEDGWRVQRFTDAALASAQQGCWAELDDESDTIC